MGKQRTGRGGAGRAISHLEEEVDYGEDDVLGDELRAAQDALAAQRGACTGVRGRRVRLGWVRRVRGYGRGRRGQSPARRSPLKQTRDDERPLKLNENL